VGWLMYGPHGQAISIDCCTARLQQARPPFDPYPQQHGGQQQMRAVTFVQRRRKLNIDLLNPAFGCQKLINVFVVVFVPWSSLCRVTVAMTSLQVLGFASRLAEARREVADCQRALIRLQQATIVASTPAPPPSTRRAAHHKTPDNDDKCSPRRRQRLQVRHTSSDHSSDAACC